MEQLSESPKGGDGTKPTLEKTGSKHHIDTAQPFESVKEAVSKFGGRIDWKSRRTQSMDVQNMRSKLGAQETGKADTAEELEATKKQIDDLNMNLERVAREEVEANEELERLSVMIEEMEEEIVSQASVEAKAQFEAEKARHAAAVSDLEFQKKELESLNKEYADMVSERDAALRKAQEAEAESKEAEEVVEELSKELGTAKESLSAIRAAHLEAEEQRMGAVDEEIMNCKVELEQAEEELQRLHQEAMSARVLKSKLDASSSLLQDLKAELRAFMESKIREEGIQKRRRELEQVKLKAEKAAEEVESLRKAANSLRAELEEEKSALGGLKQSQEKVSAEAAALQEELDKTRSAIEFMRLKEKEDNETMLELPKKLEEAAREADEAKAQAEAAQAELRQAQEEAESARALAASLEARLTATEKEINVAKASEKLAKDSIIALERTESGKSVKGSDPSVTLTLDEYQELSKRTYKAEEQANVRIAAANSLVEMAKDSEMRSLEKLEELNEELTVRRESLKIAEENAEKANQGKLAVEQELRAWRAQQEEQQRKDTMTSNNAAAAGSSSSSESTPEREDSNLKGTAGESGAAPDTKTKKKKKLKSLFPTKVVMFFSKRKTHPTNK